MEIPFDIFQQQVKEMKSGLKAFTSSVMRRVFLYINMGLYGVLMLLCVLRLFAIV